MIIIAQKLMEIHEKNIIHNDLKSDNIIVSHPGANGLPDVSLIDFGICRYIGERLALTAGASHNSFPWMAPEVLTGEPCTPAADTYSFGVLLRTAANYLRKKLRIILL